MSMDEATQKKMDHLMDLVKLSKEGYAGILPNGNIVDRREHPEAYVIPKNSMFGIPEPKDITALGGIVKPTTLMNTDEHKSTTDSNTENLTIEKSANPTGEMLQGPGTAEESPKFDPDAIAPANNPEEPIDVPEQPSSEEKQHEELHPLVGELVEVHKNNNEKFPVDEDVVNGHIVDVIDDMATIELIAKSGSHHLVYNVKDEKNCQGNGHSFFRLLPEAPLDEQAL
jgi:hypothetical protein